LSRDYSGDYWEENSQTSTGIKGLAANAIH
jgi:hypothetical protein